MQPDFWHERWQNAGRSGRRRTQRACGAGLFKEYGLAHRTPALGKSYSHLLMKLSNSNGIEDESKLL